MKSVMELEANNDIRLEDILNTMPIAVGWTNISTGRIEYLNNSFNQLFGYTLEDLPDIDTWCLRVARDKEFVQKIVEPWISSLGSDFSSEGLNVQLFCKDGSIRHVAMNFSTVGEKKLWYFNDITDFVIAEKRSRTQSDMLEMVAKSSELKDILYMLVKQIQLESPDTLCSVLLFDEVKKCLRLGSAPDLPDFYNKAIDGVVIGPGVGSCGAAAYLGERVIVEDIHSHKNWVLFAELADKANVSACWSEPIFSSKNRLLGTFAFYKRIPSSPTEKDFELINFASNLVSIAIESSKAQEELEKRASYDHLTGLCNRGYFFKQCIEMIENHLPEQCAFVMLDLDNFKSINDAYGHNTGDLVLQKLAKVSQTVLGEDSIIARIGGEEFAIFLPNQTEKQVLLLAESLRKSIEASTVLSSEKESISFTASLGVAYQEHGTYSIGELFNSADKALYKSKVAGKNSVSSIICNRQLS